MSRLHNPMRTLIVSKKQLTEIDLICTCATLTSLGANPLTLLMFQLESRLEGLSHPSVNSYGIVEIKNKTG